MNPRIPTIGPVVYYIRRAATRPTCADGCAREVLAIEPGSRKERPTL